jgi:hypothetical protein
VSESPAALLRRAAEKMRGLARDAIEAGWSGRTRIEHAYDDSPLLVSADSTHVRGIADVVDDTYAELLVALGNPTMGLLIADQWDVIAGDMEILHATDQPYGIVDHAGQAHAAWASTLDAARAFLGEEADADA